MFFFIFIDFEMDEEESTREIDRWVTSLVDLIPTTIYVRAADLAKKFSAKFIFQF